MSADINIEEILCGNVDGNVIVLQSPAAPVPELPGGLLPDGLVQSMDEACSFEEGNEFARGRHCLIRMHPAGQGLCAQKPSVNCNLRLEIDLKFSVLQRPLEGAGELSVVNGLVQHLRLVEGHALLQTFMDGFHRDQCLVAHGGHGLLRIINCIDAVGNLDAVGGAAQRALQGLGAFRQQLQREIFLLNQQGEAIVRQLSVKNVLLIRPALENVRFGTQKGRGLLPAEKLIDQLEFGNVGAEHEIIAGLVLQSFRAALLKVLPIPDSGQIVMGRLMPCPQDIAPVFRHFCLFCGKKRIENRKNLRVRHVGKCLSVSCPVCMH